MSFVLGARSVVTSRHVGAMLSAYADRSLPAAALLACDQHVAICPGCRGAVDAERRLLRSLRSSATPELSSRLESALLGLAVYDVSMVPTVRPSPLPVVGRSAPAMHRSPVRAALLASLAAGASMAAAWSVGVSSAGSTAASLPVVPLTFPAAVANSASGNGESSQATSYLSTNRAVAGITGSNELTTSFTFASATPTSVSGPWSGVRNVPELGTIGP